MAWPSLLLLVVLFSLFFARHFVSAIIHGGRLLEQRARFDAAPSLLVMIDIQTRRRKFAIAHPSRSDVGATENAALASSSRRSEATQRTITTTIDSNNNGYHR